MVQCASIAEEVTDTLEVSLNLLFITCDSGKVELDIHLGIAEGSEVPWKTAEDAEFKLFGFFWETLNVTVRHSQQEVQKKQHWVSGLCLGEGSWK